VPLSYLQPAGNGTNRTFEVPIGYLSRAHVKVYTGYDLATGIGTELLSGVGFTWLSDTSIQTTVAPANGAVLTIIRQTPSTSRLVVWSAGSPPTPTELNASDLQNFYIVQEQQDRNDAGIAQSTEAKAAGATAATAAATATTAANAATTASTSATATANSALSQSTAANSLANSALTNSQTAQTNASAALTAANTALSNTSSTLSVASAANIKADQALSAVSSTVNYTLISNVAAIPSTAANQTYIEVNNSTGIESFTPLTGRPGGFTGDTGLTVRLVYTTAGATWNWLNYFVNNADSRYLKLTGGTMAGDITLVGAPTSNLHPATKAYTDNAVSPKLDSSLAATTYQTQAGMSAYFTAAAASILPRTALVYFMSSF
jgi:hypothetical protein